MNCLFLKQEKGRAFLCPAPISALLLLPAIPGPRARSTTRSTRTAATTTAATLSSWASSRSTRSARSSRTPLARCCHRNAIGAVVVNLFALFHRRAIVFFEVFTTFDHDRARVR